jgi:hypothetical protein
MARTFCKAWSFKRGSVRKVRLLLMTSERIRYQATRSVAELVWMALGIKHLQHVNANHCTGGREGVSRRDSSNAGAAYKHTCPFFKSKSPPALFPSTSFTNSARN